MDKSKTDVFPTIPKMPNTGDNHHFIHCPKSTKLIIFFTATGAAQNQFNWWHAGNDLSNEASILFVNGWSNTWYQDGVQSISTTLEGTIRLIQDWTQSNGVTEIYCTGQSMGGYGALLFSGLLNAKAIAFGAETILGLPHSQYERKANKDIDLAYPDLAKSFEGQWNAFLITGERDPIDIYCANHMKHVPGIELRTMRFVSHGPAGYLKNRDRLVPLLRTWISGRHLPHFSEEGRALQKAGFPELFYEGWCANCDKDFAKAVTLLSEAVIIYPTNDEVRIQLAKALVGLKEFESALTHYATSYSIANRKESLVGCANCLRRMGAEREALYTYSQVIKSWDNYADAWYGMGLAYLGLGDKKRANEKFEKAVQFAPKNKTFVDRLARSRGGTKT